MTSNLGMMKTVNHDYMKTDFLFGMILLSNVQGVFSSLKQSVFGADLDNVAIDQCTADLNFILMLLISHSLSLSIYIYVWIASHFVFLTWRHVDFFDFHLGSTF